MSVIKIELPAQQPLFNCTLPVRITDINYGNHLGNDALVSILHEARVQFLAVSQLSELQVGNDIGLIMSSLAIEYKAEAFYGNELNISIMASDISTAKFNLYYSVTYNQKVIALAQTTMVCFDYSIKKVKPIPGELLQILQP
jgi:acyl-CoA thioester hydrolase